MLYDLVILYTQISIIKCNITALMFFQGSECWGGAVEHIETKQRTKFFNFRIYRFFSLGLKGSDLFMTPCAGVLVLGRGQISHIMKMHYFFKNLHQFSQAQAYMQIRLAKYIEMMTKEGSTQIVNFITPGTGVLVLGCGHIHESRWKPKKHLKTWSLDKSFN